MVWLTRQRISLELVCRRHLNYCMIYHGITLTFTFFLVTVLNKLTREFHYFLVLLFILDFSFLFYSCFFLRFLYFFIPFWRMTLLWLNITLANDWLLLLTHFYYSNWLKYYFFSFLLIYISSEFLSNYCSVIIFSISFNLNIFNTEKLKIAGLI